MSYAENFQKRVLGSISDKEDEKLLIILTKMERLENVEKEFGKDPKERIEKLTKSGLLVEILRDNPSHIQRYYQTTELGQAALRYLATNREVSNPSQ